MGQFSGCSGLRDVDARSAFRSREGKFKSKSRRTLQKFPDYEIRAGHHKH